MLRRQTLQHSSPVTCIKGRQLLTVRLNVCRWVYNHMVVKKGRLVSERSSAFIYLQLTLITLSEMGIEKRTLSMMKCVVCPIWCEYLVLPVIKILLGSITRQAKPAVWMVRRAELSWTMYAHIKDSGSRPACCRGGGGSCCPVQRHKRPFKCLIYSKGLTLFQWWITQDGHSSNILEILLK